MPEPDAPDVSIITAVYRPNPEYLLEAWRSVQAQEGPSWEWVVQVDGREEELEQWLSPEMRADERVRPEARGHFGIATTRNLALIRCRAEFVQTFDHDDVMLPGALAVGYETLRGDESLAFCFGEHVHLLPDGTLERRSESRRLEPGRIEPGEIEARWRAGKPHGIVCNTIMWRKEYVYAYGGWSALPVGDDYGLCFPVTQCHPVAYIDRDVMRWRRHPDQSSEIPERRAQTDIQRPFVFSRLDAIRRITRSDHAGRPAEGRRVLPTDEDVAAAVHAAHAAWNQTDDPEALFGRFWDDEIEWTEPATSPNAGTFRGRRAVIDYLHDWIDSVGRSEHRIEEQMVAGDQVMSAVRLSIRGRSSGVDFDAPLYFVERVREGKIDRVRVFYDRDEALSALNAAGQ
jgi:ketosteroid isomerase-like protein